MLPSETLGPTGGGAQAEAQGRRTHARRSPARRLSLTSSCRRASSCSRRSFAILCALSASAFRLSSCSFSFARFSKLALMLLVLLLTRGEGRRDFHLTSTPPSPRTNATHGVTTRGNNREGRRPRMPAQPSHHKPALCLSVHCSQGDGRIARAWYSGHFYIPNGAVFTTTTHSGKPTQLPVVMPLTRQRKVLTLTESQPFSTWLWIFTVTNGRAHTLLLLSGDPRHLAQGKPCGRSEQQVELTDSCPLVSVADIFSKMNEQKSHSSNCCQWDNSVFKPHLENVDLPP